jgi:hypothetical protein
VPAPVRFDLGSSNVNGHERNVGGDDANADEEEEASQANNTSMQNMVGSGKITFRLGTRILEEYDGEDDNDADPDLEEVAL